MSPDRLTALEELLLSAGLTWSGGSSRGGGSSGDGTDGRPGGNGTGPSVPSPADPGLPPGPGAYANMEQSEAMARLGARDTASSGGLQLSYLAAILGARSLPPAFRTMPVVVATAGGATLVFAFMFVSRRRRDGQAPMGDDMLATAAASGTSAVPAAPFVPIGGGGSAGWRSTGGSVPVGAPIDPEAHLPRWRRPSLMAARKADPLRDQREDAPMTFAASTVAASTSSTVSAAPPGVERRRIRYRLVSLLDRPDELVGVPIGTLDQGDEVQLLERAGTYWLVLCPTGQQGWVHRMTLGEVVEEPIEAASPDAWTTESSTPEAVGLLALYASRLGARDSDGVGLDGTGFAPSWTSPSDQDGLSGNGHGHADDSGHASGNGHADGNGHANPTVPPSTAPSRDPGLVDEDVLAAFLAARGERQWPDPGDDG